MRLDKFLAECNQGTRSEVKVLLKSKRVTVNGVTENSGKRQINEFSDVVCLYEKIVNRSQTCKPDKRKQQRHQRAF